MRGDHYDLSCFLYLEVSQASYIQDEGITSRYFKYVLERVISIQVQNYKKNYEMTLDCYRFYLDLQYNTSILGIFTECP